MNNDKLWAILAFIFLYLGLIIPGPFHFNGSVFVEYPCMLCVETEEYLQFEVANHFMRGFLSLSIALIVYAQWTRMVAIIFAIAIIYSPLNDLHEYVQVGDYHGIYLIFPFILNIFSEPFKTWSFYSNYEMFQMLIGSNTALISYALMHRYSSNNSRIVVPLFALFIIGFSGIYIYIFELTFQMRTAYACTLFTAGALAGFKYFVNVMFYNKSD